MCGLWQAAAAAAGGDMYTDAKLLFANKSTELGSL